MTLDLQRPAPAPEQADAASGAQEEPQASAGSFTSQGAIPPVSATAHAASAGASASDRAYGGDHGIPGGDRNVSMTHINERHHGDHQATRLGIGGHTPHIKTATHAYGNDGHALGGVHPGPLAINAGQVCHLVIDGKKTRCVFTHGDHPGWVPVEAFEHSPEIAALQTHQAHEIDHERHAAADLKHEGNARTIYAKPTPAAQEKLFTKPHQHADSSNHAHDYGVRAHGMVNLLLNVPTWTAHGASEGERFGSAVDVIKAAPWPAKDGAHVEPESQFHQVGGPVQVPLFHHNSEHQAGHLTFVYGYVVNNAGEKRLGWINEHLLGS